MDLHFMDSQTLNGEMADLQNRLLFLIHFYIAMYHREQEEHRQAAKHLVSCLRHGCQIVLKKAWVTELKTMLEKSLRMARIEHAKTIKIMKIIDSLC